MGEQGKFLDSLLDVEDLFDDILDPLTEDDRVASFTSAEEYEDGLHKEDEYYVTKEEDKEKLYSELTLEDIEDDTELNDMFKQPEIQDKSENKDEKDTANYEVNSTNAVNEIYKETEKDCFNFEDLEDLQDDNSDIDFGGLASDINIDTEDTLESDTEDITESESEGDSWDGTEDNLNTEEDDELREIADLEAQFKVEEDERQRNILLEEQRRQEALESLKKRKEEAILRKQREQELKQQELLQKQEEAKQREELLRKQAEEEEKIKVAQLLENKNPSIWGGSQISDTTQRKLYAQIMKYAEKAGISIDIDEDEDDIELLELQLSVAKRAYKKKLKLQVSEQEKSDETDIKEYAVAEADVATVVEDTVTTVTTVGMSDGLKLPPELELANQTVLEHEKELQSYSDMSVDTLYKIVKQFLLAKGVRNSLVPISDVEAKFGKENVRRLRNKGFIVLIKNGVTLGQ